MIIDEASELMREGKEERKRVSGEGRREVEEGKVRLEARLGPEAGEQHGVMRTG